MSDLTFVWTSRKRAIRKGYTIFSVFNFWDWKLVPINSVSNSASKNLTYFFQKSTHGTKKSIQTWKSWKVLEPKFFHRKFTRNSVGEIGYVKFLFRLSDLWHALFSAKNRIFPRKGRRDRALIFAYLYSPIVDVFSGDNYRFRFWPSSGKNVGVKVGTKLQILSPSLFHKNSNL